MVSTNRIWTNMVVTAEFNDKNTFILVTQPHDFALHGILCEKGQKIVSLQ